MDGDEVSPAMISNDIEQVIRSNGDPKPERLARDIADELVAKYEIRLKPPGPNSYKDKPRRGRIW
jgi:hypothetical protein